VDTVIGGGGTDECWVGGNDSVSGCEVVH
jgi:hypothetical protein